jgi:hypothetical protein
LTADRSSVGYNDIVIVSGVFCDVRATAGTSQVYFQA